MYVTIQKKKKKKKKKKQFLNGLVYTTQHIYAKCQIPLQKKKEKSNKITIRTSLLNNAALLVAYLGAKL